MHTKQTSSNDKKKFTHKTSAFVSCTFCTPDRATIKEHGEKFLFVQKLKKIKLSLKVGNISSTL